MSKPTLQPSPTDQPPVKFSIVPLRDVPELLVCPECGAAVLFRQAERHGQWHRDYDRTHRDVTGR